MWADAIQRTETMEHNTIVLTDLTQVERQLATELWAVLGTKLGGEAWEHRRNVEDGNGLELWRVINQEYDRKTPGRASAIKKVAPQP